MSLDTLSLRLCNVRQKSVKASQGINLRAACELQVWLPGSCHGRHRLPDCG